MTSEEASNSPRALTEFARAITSTCSNPKFAQHPGVRRKRLNVTNQILLVRSPNDFLGVFYVLSRLNFEDYPMEDYPIRDYSIRNYPTRDYPIRHYLTKDYPIGDYPIGGYPTRDYPIGGSSLSGYLTGCPPRGAYLIGGYPREGNPSETMYEESATELNRLSELCWTLTVCPVP